MLKSSALADRQAEHRPSADEEEESDVSELEDSGRELEDKEDERRLYTVSVYNLLLYFIC